MLCSRTLHCGHKDRLHAAASAGKHEAEAILACTQHRVERCETQGEGGGQTIYKLYNLPSLTPHPPRSGGQTINGLYNLPSLSFHLLCVLETCPLSLSTRDFLDIEGAAARGPACCPRSLTSCGSRR